MIAQCLARGTLSHDLSTMESTRHDLRAAFQEVRSLTTELTLPLQAEDLLVSVTADTSPAKWHLAHTTWFFERMILSRFVPGYEAVDPAYDFLFNSYYETAGAFLAKKHRPSITRPSSEEVFAYRAQVDERMESLLRTAEDSVFLKIRPLVELGLNHEQQHQELLLMDVKRNFFANPLRPAYREQGQIPHEVVRASGAMTEFSGGRFEIGHRGSTFAYDNESGRHSVWLEPFALAQQPVTNAEYLEFIEAGAYRKPELWLSDAWSTLKSEGWQAPLYWEEREGRWFEMTLAGLRALDLAQPVAHLSYYEAQAYAHWKKMRLPTEAEWEVAAAQAPVQGQFLEDASGIFQPAPIRGDGRLEKMHGGLWEWTQSAYLPYPRYQPYEQELAEYNGKFMCNQMVLRGGSCATPRSHYRATYRNFYYPHMRWQFCGMRLARDL